MNNCAARELAEQWPLRRCMRRGFEVGCAYAMLQFMATATGVDFEAEVGLGLPTLVTLDLCAGALSGALVGLFMPLVTSGMAAAALGAVAFFPAMLPFMIAIYGYSTDNILRTAAGSCVIGAALGLSGWHRFHSK